jgi:hypothetical protein
MRGAQDSVCKDDSAQPKGHHVVITVKHVHGCSAKSVTPVIVIIALILATGYAEEIRALRLDKTRILGVSAKLRQASRPKFF